MKTSPRWAQCLAIIGWVASAAPGVSWAQEDFEHSIDTVRQLLESQRYEQAIARLDRLKPLVRDETQRVVVSLYEGLVLSNMGRQTQDRALAAFKSALQLDPRTHLPVKVAPQLERNFEGVRTRVLKELAERPSRSVDSAATFVSVAPVEITASPLSAEPEHVLASTPAELEIADRLRLLSKWPALAPVSMTGSGLVAESFRDKARRPRVLVPAITAGAMLLSGGVFLGLARREQSRLRHEDFSNRPIEDARRIAVNGTRYQMWGFGLMGAGGAALGVATVFYALQGPKTPVSLGLSATGTSAFLEGTWP